MRQSRTMPLHLCAGLVSFVLLADPRPIPADSLPISTPTIQTAGHPNVSEVRGLWVVRNSITSPLKIQHLVQAAADNGFNTLFVQVRGRGDAYYNSSIEPRAEDLASQPASFDPLQTIINDAHAHGIQVHAWINACYVWSSNTPPHSAQHIVNQHPDWMARDTNGYYTIGPDAHNDGAFVSPSNPQVRQELHDVCMEVTKNYDIDGIHFDYIRYPDSNYDYSAQTVGAFAATMRSKITPTFQASLDSRGDDWYTRVFPDQWAQWRRDQVTSLVQKISRDVKAAKPWVVTSAAVYADWHDAYFNRGQDWHKWLLDGDIDAVVPMAYSVNTGTVITQIADAQAIAKASGRACFAGLGSWHMPCASTLDKIGAVRRLGAAGIVLFSYGGVTSDGSTNIYLNKVDRSAFQVPATVPNLPSVGVRPGAKTAGIDSDFTEPKSG